MERLLPKWKNKKLSILQSWFRFTRPYLSKKYKENGELDSVLYHLVFSVIPNDPTDNDLKLVVGDTIQLSISIDHSEYDSVEVGALVDYDKETPGYEDTVRFSGNTLICSIPIKSAGEDTIRGIFVEFNANAHDTESEYGGSKPFLYVIKSSASKNDELK